MSRLGHYRLLERIGSGGMGVVHRARDERDGRMVAVKVLHAGALADDVSRRRFRREAAALSRLQHPNVAALHDFDTHQDIDYIVMELLDGVPLAERLREGPLPEPEVVRIATAVAGALEAAHAQGVVHRDLKPSNILLTPAGLKVVDFGLAKLETTRSRDMSERLSSLMPAGGTLHYMSPEQVLGHDVDGRSDLYTLGCVMYEMLSGRTPFASDVPALLSLQILKKRPLPLRAEGRSPSPRLECSVLRLLEKRPARRHPDATALLADLRSWSDPLPASGAVRLELARHGSARLVGVSCIGAVLVGGSFFAMNPQGVRRSLGLGPAPIRSLAVLPFVNLSNDPEQEFLADGMTEDFIAELARRSTLRVISRTSVMRYKRAGRALPEIGRELGVDAVVEGSVVRRGDQVRLVAQLIDVRGERHVWGESYDRRADDLPSLRVEVPLAVLAAISSRRPAAERERAPPVLRPEVYDLLLKGRYYVGRSNLPDLQRAAAYFREAIRLQADCSEAHSRLAECYLQLALNNAMPDTVAYPLALSNARRAVEIDPRSDDAHAVLGRLLHIVEWRFAEAREHLRLAVQLNPGGARALRAYGTHLATMGFVEELLAVTRRAYDVDPVSLPAIQSYTYALKSTGRLDEAIAMAHRALELDSTRVAIRAELVEAYWARGDRAASCEQMLRYYQDVPIPEDQQATLRTALQKGGPEGFWRAELARCGFDFVNPVHIASLYMFLGRPDSALVFLERAHEKHFQGLLYIKTTPDFWSLQPDPRFQALLKRMGIPPEPLPFVTRRLARRREGAAPPIAG